MRQLKFYRLSQAANYVQADNDGATVTVEVDTEAWKFSDVRSQYDALSITLDVVTKTVYMMDGNEQIAWRLMDGNRLLDTFNEPEIKLTPDEEAFIKAYDSNVAIHDGKTVKEFLLRERSGDWDYMAEGFPASMMDAWCMWHAAQNSIRQVLCPSCGFTFPR